MENNVVQEEVKQEEVKQEKVKQEVKLNKNKLPSWIKKSVMLGRGVRVQKLLSKTGKEYINLSRRTGFKDKAQWSNFRLFGLDIKDGRHIALANALNGLGSLENLKIIGSGIFIKKFTSKNNTTYYQLTRNYGTKEKPDYTNFPIFQSDIDNGLNIAIASALIKMVQGE